MTRWLQIKDDYLELHAEGITARQAAERLGVSPRTIQRTRDRLGLSQPTTGGGKRPTPEQLEYARQLLEDGCSMTDAARSAGTTFNALKRRWPDKVWDPTTVGQYARQLDQLKRLELGRTK
ncbi:helix-turn-helix DNA-binding domain protein [Arthrobacter phage Andrew]|uniref:Helix-turn-helix DNA-binding domain protein n=1 Tax=Arthrobacter phage Andrew TaxID=2419946 RepID=A0A3G2KCY0_9CAUD|nr:DNA binding protein [Arthrobacter phage Andrew]AYN56847.1 helix-turn-helix DNA-binding domain protein [Arthrobacter phage Andrew]